MFTVILIFTIIALILAIVNSRTFADMGYPWLELIIYIIQDLFK